MERQLHTHLNFIHQFHSLNDADCLALGDLVSLLAEGGLSRSRRSVEAACHGRCHLQKITHSPSVCSITCRCCKQHIHHHKMTEGHTPKATERTGLCRLQLVVPLSRCSMRQWAAHTFIHKSLYIQASWLLAATDSHAKLSTGGNLTQEQTANFVSAVQMFDVDAWLEPCQPRCCLNSSHHICIAWTVQPMSVQPMSVSHHTAQIW